MSTSEVQDDWAERWKASTARSNVRPLGRAGAAPLGARRPCRSLELDRPGQAFGTGAHPDDAAVPGAAARARAGGRARRLGLRQRRARDRRGAARLGPGARATTTTSIEATRANAAANGVPDPIGRIDLRRAEGPWAPTVVANLVRPLLLDIAAAMARAPERLIVSGLLREEADEVAAAFARHGLGEAGRRHGGEWAALLLE